MFPPVVIPSSEGQESRISSGPIFGGQVKRIIRKAGLNHIRVHDLRHTHATLMLKAGVHPKIISERLGHASIGITLDTYSHVLPGLQEAAAEQFDRVLDIDKPAEIRDSNVSKMLARKGKLNSRPCRSRTCDTLIKSLGLATPPSAARYDFVPFCLTGC